MFRAFSLDVREGNPFASWHQRGKAFIEGQWPKSERAFDSYVEEAVIDGDGIKDHWFSKLNADVFISHSHSDEAMAVGLAGYLADLGLRPFVDSLVWHDSVTLLNSIDRRFCRSDDDPTMFDYNKRNYSTSHVHMMLASALAESIDQCECVLFLNTPRSIQVRDSKAPNEAVTASPWIYHELITTQLIRRRRHDDRVTKGFGIEDARVLDEAVRTTPMRVEYRAPMDHLAKLTLQSLENLRLESLERFEALDELYRKHPAPGPENR